MDARKEIRPDIPALARTLQQGLALQQSGRQAEAEKVYRSLLQHYPSQVDVLQLLGLALKAQGQIGEAEHYLRRSLALNPKQAHVWANLGNLLLERESFAEAAIVYRESLRLNEKAANTWYGLGRALLGLNDIDDAEAAFTRAAAILPSHALAKIGLAEVATRREDDDAAEEVLRGVIAHDPDHALALHALGANLMRRCRPAEARPLIEKANRLQPSRPEVLTTLGYTVQQQGQYEQAIALYREALARNPFHSPAYVNLSRLLWHLDRRQEEFTADIDAAIARFPEIVELHNIKGDLLAYAQRFPEACDSFARAVELAPAHPYAQDGVGRMCTELGDAATAFEHHAKAVESGGPTPVFRASYGYSLLQLGEPRAAIKVLDEALQYDPFDQASLSTLTLALRATNDPREQWLADYESLAQALQIPVPRGYTDMAGFIADLKAAVNTLHDSEDEPASRSLRKGTQTMGRLFGRGIELVDRLRESLDETILDYVRALPDDDRHPHLARKAQRFGYRGSWSVRLHDTGFHVNHFHPTGWISSCYYVSLPDSVADTEGKQGWLTLGAPPFDMGWDDPVRRYIQPREGMLILFPSYFYHGTVAFHSPQARTTIAFDAVPVP